MRSYAHVPAVFLIVSLLALSGCGKAKWKNADNFKVNGVRLDPGFKTNGIVHLGMSAVDKDGNHILVENDSKDFSNMSVVLKSLASSTGAEKVVRVHLEVLSRVEGSGDLPIYSGVLVDNSGSNSDTDPKWSRIDGASRAVKSFCTKAQNRVYVGLFGDPASNAFASTKFEGADSAATTTSQLTKACSTKADVDGLVAALGAVKARGVGSQGTPLYSSLRENITFLQKAEAELGKSQKVILLTSDGQPTDSYQKTADYESFVVKSGVTLFTVGYGPSSPVTVDGKRSPELDPAAVTVLQQLAQWSNGFYMPLTQSKDLETHIDGLSSALNHGYILLKMVVDIEGLGTQEVVSGTITVSDKSDSFSFLTP